MKAAMWGVGLFVMGLLGLILINLFGNITVTNQFNYTTMKNTVQAAMLDSLDIAHYRAGFCLCTKDGSVMNTETLRSFSDQNQYEFRDVVSDKCVNADDEVMNNCVTLYGEYRLNKEKFEKTFEERFGNVKTNNKGYEYIIKEVIEYPPKVSVMVISQDEEFFATDKEAGGYNIVNQIDAIVETNGNITVNYAPQPTVEKHTITSHHYLEGTTTKVHADTKITKNKGEKYSTSSIATSSLDSKYKNGYAWNGKTPTNASGTVGSSDITVTYYYKANPVKQYTITVHHYVQGTTTKVHADTKITKAKGEKYTTSYFTTGQLDSKYKNKYVWNGKTPTNASGTVGNKDITLTYQYKAASTSTNTSSDASQCKWHYLLVCSYDNIDIFVGGETKTPFYFKQHTSSRGSFASSAEAISGCKADISKCEGAYIEATCNAVRDYSCTENGKSNIKFNLKTAPSGNCKCLG